MVIWPCNWWPMISWITNGICPRAMWHLICTPVLHIQGFPCHFHSGQNDIQGKLWLALIHCLCSHVLNTTDEGVLGNCTALKLLLFVHEMCKLITLQDSFTTQFWTPLSCCHVLHQTRYHLLLGVYSYHLCWGLWQCCNPDMVNALLTSLSNELDVQPRKPPVH